MQPKQDNSVNKSLVLTTIFKMADFPCRVMLNMKHSANGIANDNFVQWQGSKYKQMRCDGSDVL